MNWVGLAGNKRWALLLICVVVVTFIVILGRNDSGRAYAKAPWEYKVVEGNVVGAGDPERGLNQLGMDGWELVNFIRTDGSPERSGTWIFKRPK